MKYVLRLTDSARKNLASLDFHVQKIIARKIDFYLSAPDPLKYAQALRVPFQGSYRFRIGEYRVMFKIEPSGIITILLILNIKHRKDSYRH